MMILTRTMTWSSLAVVINFIGRRYFVATICKEKLCSELLTGTRKLSSEKMLTGTPLRKIVPAPRLF